MKDCLNQLLVNTPRAIGKLVISAKFSDSRSSLHDLYQNGCLKSLFPKKSSELEAVIINTSGGITGGDRLTINAKAAAEAQITLTTQACERIYKAQPDTLGEVNTCLHVASGAFFKWLPQETIIYNYGALNRRLKVFLEKDAKFLMVEPVIFGRREMGENQVFGLFNDQINLSIDGFLAYRDNTILSGDITAQLARPAVASGMAAMASLLYRGSDATLIKTKIPNYLNKTSGCSLLPKDLLVMRLLARDGYALRQMMVPILELLTQNTLPRCWRL